MSTYKLTEQKTGGGEDLSDLQIYYKRKVQPQIENRKEMRSWMIGIYNGILVWEANARSTKLDSGFYHSGICVGDVELKI